MTSYIAEYDKIIAPTLNIPKNKKFLSHQKNKVVIKFNAESHKLRIHIFVDLHLTERDYLIYVIRKEYANVTIFVAYYKYFYYYCIYVPTILLKISRNVQKMLNKLNSLLRLLICLIALSRAKMKVAGEYLKNS